LKSTENELGQTLSADKTKDIIKSNGIVGMATSFMTNDTHVNTSIEKESYLKDVEIIGFDAVDDSATNCVQGLPPSFGNIPVQKQPHSQPPQHSHPPQSQHGNDAKEDIYVLRSKGDRTKPLAGGFRDRDVLLGKGKEQNQNSGNVKYSEHIKSKSQEYTTKKNRRAIINSLTSTFCFYKKHNKTGSWKKVESTQPSISNKIKRDFAIDLCRKEKSGKKDNETQDHRCVKDKIEIKKVGDIEKEGAQDTTAKFSDSDRDWEDNSPSKCMEPRNEYKTTRDRQRPNVRNEKTVIEGGENTKASNSDNFSYSAKYDYNIPASNSIDSKGTVGNLTLAGKKIPTKPRFKPQKNRKTKKAEKGSIDIKQNEIMTSSSCAPINPKSHTSLRDDKCLLENDYLMVNLSHSHNFLSPMDEERLPKNNHSRFENMPSNLNSSRISPPSPERRFVFHSSNSKAKLATQPVHTDSFMGMSLKDALIEQERLIRGAAARVRNQTTFRVISQCERMSNLISPRTFKVVVRDIHLRYSDHWEYTDYYSRLGLPRNANESTVKAAYRRLCKIYHPDRNIGKFNTKHKFQAVAEAYNSLMNIQIA